MDDVNEMNDSMDSVERTGVIGRALGTSLDRRTMLKAAVAAGTVAGTWVAPRIESLGFAPAGAATPCIRLSPEADDKNSNDADAYCEPNATPCCGQSFGSNGTSAERFTFSNPGPTGCTEIVVRTISLDCNTTEGGGAPPRPTNPDVGQFALIIESFTETTPGACANCQILDAVLIDSQQRTVLASYNNGAFSCPSIPGANPIGDGIDASIDCDDPLLMSDARLAVRLTCTVVGTCNPTP